jgi:hypothetical protein
LLFDEWLAERRRKAAIEWHWDLGGERGASRDAGRNLMM